MSIRYLHAMIRTDKPEESHRFYTEGLGLIQTRRMDSEKGQFSLIYYAIEKGAQKLNLLITGVIEAILAVTNLAISLSKWITFIKCVKNCNLWALPYYAPLVMGTWLSLKTLMAYPSNFYRKRDH